MTFTVDIAIYEYFWNSTRRMRKMRGSLQVVNDAVFLEMQRCRNQKDEVKK